MDRKEKLYAFLNEQAKVPLLAEEIALMLGAEDEKDEVLKLLEELTNEGKIVKGKKGRYESAEKRGIFVGVYRHNAKGFGFVSGEGEDFFIPEEGRGGAYSGDAGRDQRFFADGHRCFRGTNLPWLDGHPG